MRTLFFVVMSFGIYFSSLTSQAAPPQADAWSIVGAWLESKYTGCGEGAHDAVNTAVISNGLFQRKIDAMAADACKDLKSAGCAATFEKEFGSRLSTRAEQHGCKRMSDTAAPSDSARPAVN